jgi:hypothetical protein
MADQPTQFRVVVQARGKPAGTYVYVITKSDDTHWAETSIVAYATPEAASEAGKIALERLLSHQRAIRP